MTGQNLLVIDGHNFLWRAFSVPFNFSSKKGTPLHVVSSYLKLVRRTVQVMDDLGKVDSVVVVFDSDTGNSNFDLSPEYKANRKRDSSFDEDSPFRHLPYIKQALTVLGIPYLEIPNIEADDVIASLVTNFNRQDKGNRSFILSSDTDFYQLLNAQTKMVKLKPKEEYELIDEGYVRNKLGISCLDYVYFKSLVGDKADNIKGIKGIGPVSAQKIIHGKMGFNPDEFQDLLELNRKLIGLNFNLEISCNLTPINLDNLKLPNKDLFQLCDF